MVIITIFSVGYGEVRSIDDPKLKFFTMGLIVSGCSTGLWVIGGLVEFMADVKIREALGKRRVSQQIDKMTKHTIVCGFGRVGQILCRDLAAAGVPLLVIDAAPQRLALAESLGYPTVAGDAAEEHTLRAAHIETASVVAVVLPDDAANVFVTLSARELSDTVQIIALRKSDGEIRRSPHGTTLLESGDAVILVGRHGDLPRSLRRLAAATAVTWRGSSTV